MVSGEPTLGEVTHDEPAAGVGMLAATDARVTGSAGRPATPSPLNLPNAITVNRLILALILFVLIDLEGWWRTSAVLFAFAAATDFLDGYFARRWGQVTQLGRILDPFVDKIIVCGSFLFLVRHPESGVCGWVAFTVFAREMLVTSIRSVLEGRGVDFSAKWSGKLKMVVQCITVTVCLLSLSPQFAQDLSMSTAAFERIRDVCVYATMAVTIGSGAEYCYRAARLLTPGR